MSTDKMECCCEYHATGGATGPSCEDRPNTACLRTPDCGCPECLAEQERVNVEFEAFLETVECESDRVMLREAYAHVEGRMEGAYWDAGFDGGEFSGPAHAESLDRELTETAEKFGRDRDYLDALMARYEHLHEQTY